MNLSELRYKIRLLLSSYSKEELREALEAEIVLDDIAKKAQKLKRFT